MAKALITGVLGQDGAYLARLLLDKGYAVIGTTRDTTRASFANHARLGIEGRVELASLDPLDIAAVRTILERHGPGEVYHLAGQSSVGLSFAKPAETFASIADATLNLLEGARGMTSPPRIFLAGSGDCFGDTGQVPADESTPFAPRSPYAAAKAAAYWLGSTYRQAYELFVATGLLFNHESPLRPDKFVTRKIVATACRIAKGSGETLTLGNTDIYRDWGWAPEYVDAMWRMLQADVPADYVLATGKTYGLEDFLAEVFAALDLDWREHCAKDPELCRAADIHESRANPSKALRELGWQAANATPEVARLLVAAEQGLSARREGFMKTFSSRPAS
jgi:GDPmannose 4,6-dehydratase